MDALFVLLVFFSMAKSGTSQGLCTTTDGSCSWVDPVNCDQPYACVDSEECLVVTKSINASYPTGSSGDSNRQFQCRCSRGNVNCTGEAVEDASVYKNCSTNKLEFHGLDYMYNGFDFVYAQIWKCRNETDTPLCPSEGKGIGGDLGCKGAVEILPNVFGLIRHWCQNKSACPLDLSKIMSYVDQSAESPQLPEKYVFEWRVRSFNRTLNCTEPDSTKYEDTCYKLTPPNLGWREARSYCLRRGGDLTEFSNYLPFTKIVRELDPSALVGNNFSTGVPLWFKWYSWTGEQRIPQNYYAHTDGFQCIVYNNEADREPTPSSYCSKGSKSKKSRGLCSLPPTGDDFTYLASKCPYRCAIGYVDYCWNETNADTVAKKECPQGLQGTATWSCGIDGEWSTVSPNLSGCSNPIVAESISKAKEDIKEGDPKMALDDLTDAIRKEALASANIGQIDETIQLAIQKQKELLANHTDEVQKDKSSKGFTTSVTGLNNVVLESNVAFWGLESISRAEAIDAVQKSMDDTLYLLADNLIDQKFTFHELENILIQAEKKPKSDYNNKTYSYAPGAKDQIILPAGFPYATDNELDDTRLSYSFYPGFQNILYGDVLNFYHESNGTGPLRQILASNVLGATLGNPKDTVNLVNGKVEILLSTRSHHLFEFNRSSARCAYWDVNTQEWAFDGCELIPSRDETTTRCRCDHLTNFAVLMDINGLFENKTVVALDYITVVGQSISIACLASAIIIFYGVRNLRRDFRFHVHRNLCLNLMIAEIILLAGLDAISNADLCLAIGVFLHFFFLCAFGWMFVEGLYMYFLVTKVFDGSGLKRWQYYIIAYGFPALIVSITLIATNTDAYRNSSYCWLSYENGSIWAFAGPVAGVVMINAVFLVVALSVSFKAKRQRQGKQGKNFRWIFGTCSLTFVLGITWLFGFLYYGQGTMVLAYIYTILNSLQGVFIFVTFCLLNKQVRNDLRRQIVASETTQRIGSWFNIEVSDRNRRGKSSSDIKTTKATSSTRAN